jgi:hypothetical protein
VFAQLQAGVIRNGNFNAFRKSGVEAEQPTASWHYRYNDRIAPVLAVANEVRPPPRPRIPRDAGRLTLSPVWAVGVHAHDARRIAEHPARQPRL